MVLLQAAMAAGFILFICLGIFILIGVPFLTAISMKIFWRLSGKHENIKNKIAYYKDTFPFVISVLRSFVTVIMIFYFLIILFDKIFPGFGYSN